MKKKSIKKLQKNAKNLVLLYVEDDEIVAKQTILVLKNFFDKIVYAKNGQEGLLKFNENYIDLIITDIEMPFLNGFDMLKEIEKIDKKIPSIITTAYNKSRYYQEAIDLNVKGYLLKPSSINVLMNIISKIIKEKKKENLKEDKLNYLMNANQELIDIGYQITNEKDHNKLLEIILMGAKDLSNSDGGTLYLFDSVGKTLEFKIVFNASLNIHHSETKNQISWPALKMYNEDKTVNKKNVAVVCAAEDKLININDVYRSTTFDFSGAKFFDTNNNYKTTSMLVIPMKNRNNELFGVIQLVNKIDKNNKIISFNKDDESIIASMASLATMILENNQLVIDLEKLLYALVKSIGSALSEKSKYTAKHVNNVAILSEIIANGINKNKTTYKNTSFTNDELEEIRLAAWLHDIGKITTPEYIVDKATKLETIYDRINVIESKFEILKRDIEILFLKGEISATAKDKKYKEIEDDILFIREINKAEVFMSEEYIQRLNKIALDNSIIVNNKEEKLFSKNELDNLLIPKGTLTKEEREIINNHASVTYKMLKELPFPKKFINIPRIAGSHHKAINGGGYCAKELKNLEMTLQEKILVIADIFEALSAQDRPYREPNTLNQIARIFSFMIKDNILDKDLVRLFFEDKLHLDYAKENLNSSQIDEIKIDFSKL